MVSADPADSTVLTRPTARRGLSRPGQATIEFVLGVSILLLVKNKIAFWVPLTAGVVAAIVFWGSLMAIVFSDPSLMSGSL